jgi:hypothetical protein
VPPEFPAGAGVHESGQAAVRGCADHDGSGDDGGGVFGDHPARGAVVGGVQLNLALGRDVAGGQPVEVGPDQRCGGTFGDLPDLTAEGDLQELDAALAAWQRLRGKHWSVVVTYRGQRVRIISARRSRKEEVALYEG